MPLTEPLRRALDDLLDARPEPAMLALGEPTHGVAAFPRLRDDLLAHLVGRGFRSIVLETDVLAAGLVDAYVTGADGDLDTVLATGFSHGFGAIPGNRALVEWLRSHNADRAPGERVRFHGFDAPVEFAAAPSPRISLAAVVAALPAELLPDSARDLDAVAGPDADWSAEAAMWDASASIGDSDRAGALGRIAEDLVAALGRVTPDPVVAGHARSATGLLRYHATMATARPDRIDALGAVRSAMMAENLVAIAAEEAPRGPSLVFAHNAHLLRTGTTAAARAAVDRYVMIATDGHPAAEPGTLQGVLAAATDQRTLFAVPPLLAALPSEVSAPMLPGHIPLTLADLDGADAVVFVTDTDGTRHRYW